MKKRAWVIAGVAVIVAIPGLLLWDAHRRASAIIFRHRVDVGLKMARLRSDGTVRPSYLEPAVEGNASPHYRQAIAELSRLTSSEVDVFPSLSGDDPKPSCDAAKMEPVLAKLKPCFEELAKGLSSSYVRPDYKYVFGQESATSSHGVLKLSKILADCADLRRTQGRPSEAVDFIVLGLGVCTDSGERGELIHVLVELVGNGVMLRPARTLLKEGLSDPAALARLQQALDRCLARDVQIMESIRTDILMIKEGLIANGFGAYGEIAKLSFGKRARHLFSDHILTATFLGELDDTLEITVKWPTLTLAERQKLTSFESEKGDRIVPLDYFPRTLQQGERLKLDLRLARLATRIAAYRAEHGDFPKMLPEGPADSYSGLPWKYVVTPTEAKVYSVGGNLKDDGGKALDDGDYDGDGDVVWVVGGKK